MKLKYLRNVATLKLDPGKCVGCGLCADVCPHGVFDLADGKAKITDLNSCMECGACAMNCAVSAISVSPGVGCASAIINGLLTGSEPSCSCSGDDCC